MREKVSVIMGVYNRISYLERAVNSVLSQSFAEFKLILIDDGSTDGSSELCDKFKSMDERVLVVHHENRGISSVRQEGIGLANGDYCIHVDSDDYVSADYLEKLYSIAVDTNSDMVWCDCYMTKPYKIWKINECSENVDAFLGKLLQGKTWGVLWNKLIRTSICKDERVSFPEECSHSEDWSFLVQCLSLSKNISYCPEPLYYYETDEHNSLLADHTKRNFYDDLIRAYSHVDVFLKRFRNVDDIPEMDYIKIFALKGYIDNSGHNNYDVVRKFFPEAVKRVFATSFPMSIKMSIYFISNRLDFLAKIVMFLYKLKFKLKWK